MLELKHVTHQYKYGAQSPIHVSFKTEDGHVFCVLGDSQSGKTSLLETIAGLLKIDDGALYLNNEEITKTGAKSRSFTLIQNKANCFKNKSVKYNLIYPLKIRKFSDGIIQNKLNFVIDKFKISEILNKTIKNLTLQEFYRFLFARVFIRDSEVYLFDDIFKNNDELFNEFLPYILELSSKKTVIYASSNFNEISQFSEPILFLNYGIAEQFGTISNIRNLPSNINLYKYCFNEWKIANGIIDEFYVLEFGNYSFQLSKSLLLSDIYINTDVTVCFTSEKNEVSNVCIYDSNCERLIYFKSIDI